MERLLPVTQIRDIPEDLLESPVGMLLRYHNLGQPYEKYTKAGILIGMCMDNRTHLRIPDNFAYILRTGGGNMRYSEFKVSYAIAVGGISHIALIGHNNCGMVNLFSKKQQFINGLTDNAGWDNERAEEHFTHFAPMFEIDNEIDFLLSETQRLRSRYPKICVFPMFYRTEDNLLYLISE